MTNFKVGFSDGSSAPKQGFGSGNMVEVKPDSESKWLSTISGNYETSADFVFDLYIGQITFGFMEYCPI